MQKKVRLVHKYLGLTLAVFWFLQAVSGVLLIYHRQLDDWLAGAHHSNVDPISLAQALDRSRRLLPDAEPYRIMASGAHRDHIDVDFKGSSGELWAVRVDLTGPDIHRISRLDASPQASVMQLAFLFHRDLLAGSTGHVLVGISGLFLIVSVVLGVQLAWPRKRQWKLALIPGRWSKPAVRPLYSWHKAVGLWIAAPLLISATTGAAMVWSATLQDTFGISFPSPVGAPSEEDSAEIGPDQAVAIARSLFPAATFSLVDLPSDGAPWYRVRLRQSGEARQTFGMTSVHVDAFSGEVLAVHDPWEASVGQTVIGGFFPIHTGEILGTPGRLMLLLSGLGFAFVCSFGVALWAAKRMRKTGSLLPNRTSQGVPER
jgi:uncharacterized iron-regulated membrane protein